MTTAQKIAEYNQANPGYAITNIKSTTKAGLDYMRSWQGRCTDLYDLYQKPSSYKREAWNDNLIDYQPREIISVQGNAMTFSVWLVANNGDVMHITRDNNYLVTVEG